MAKKPVIIYSKPTRCVKCSVTNVMTHSSDVDVKTGGWKCSTCGHLYLFAHWKIQKAGQANKRAA
jgi:hypothetical protein